MTKTGTTTTATIAGGKSNAVDLKSRRRVSLSSALRRHSFAKQPQTFASTIDSTVTTTSQRTVSPPSSLPTDDFSVAPIDSDSSDRASLITSKSITSNKNPSRRKSSSLIPGSYRKDFMQKIERFRYIDDSASSTTTITSPVESIERANASFQPCSHLITSAIEQFDDYVRAQYPQDTHEDINSLIDRLDSEMIINGSYSDLNILNQSSITRERPQSFKPVNDRSFQPTRVSQRHARCTGKGKQTRRSARTQTETDRKKEDLIVPSLNDSTSRRRQRKVFYCSMRLFYDPFSFRPLLTINAKNIVQRFIVQLRSVFLIRSLHFLSPLNITDNVNRLTR